MKPGQMFSAALKLAEQGHAGQFDKGGTPYIFHQLTVMKNLKTSDEELQCIALLHDYRIAEVDWIRLAAEYLCVQVDESLPVISGSFDTTLCETLDLISECKDMTKPTVKWQECANAVNRTAARLRNKSQLNVLNIDFVKDVWTNRLPTALKETLLEALLTDDFDSPDIHLMIQAYKQLQEHGFLPEK